jgi:arsenate reductase (thioredoxin)
MKTVLFACVHNAGRSQMAAAFFNLLADPLKAVGVSAGTQPGSRVHPEVAAAMREVGVELADIQPRFLSPELERSVDFLVTMGCGESCPLIPAAKREDWPLPDPKGKPIETVREIRDEVRRRIEGLLDAQGWAP